METEDKAEVVINMVLEPAFVNVGMLQVGVVSNNSTVVAGNSDSGDTYSVQKFNQGFGSILGNFNAVMSNLNCIYDPDVVEQNSPQFRYEPSVGGPVF